MSQDTEQFLAHYGVKGMQWGKRKTPAQIRSSRIKTLERQRDRLDGQRVFDGASLRNWGIKKTRERSLKKGLNQREVQRVGARRAATSVVLKGSTEIAVILAGATLGLNALSVSPRAKQGAQFSAVLLAGQAGKMRIGELRDLRQIERQTDILAELDQLKKRK